MAYVDFGYGNGDNEISRDGELLATLGFTWEELSSDRNPALSTAFTAAKLKANRKWKNPHSGYTWGCVVNVACVLVKHGWKTIDDIPADHPLRERVIGNEQPEPTVYKPVGKPLPDSGAAGHGL